jgi:hypothetical protein
LIGRSNSGGYGVMERDPSEGPLGTQNLGETVDVLTRDERGGETDNEVVVAVCPYAEWRGRGERENRDRRERMWLTG